MRTLPALPTAPKETWRRLSKELRRPHFTLEDLLANGFALLGFTRKRSEVPEIIALLPPTKAKA